MSHFQQSTDRQETIIARIEYNLQDIEKTVSMVWEMIKNYHIICFNGEMGAGKTTFIVNLCRHLHVPGPANSPTFTIINEYHYTDSTSTNHTIFHIDAYRLRNEDEAIQAGVEDCMLQSAAGNYCFIEWAEKIRGILPRKLINIDIHTIDPEKRTLTISQVN